MVWGRIMPTGVYTRTKEHKEKIREFQFLYSNIKFEILQKKELKGLGVL